MADLISMLSACGATEGEATDADFQNTVLLLHGDGTNGAQNNTFLDSSTNNFTITRNGNTTQGSFSPFSKPDGRWGNYFGSTSANLKFASNAAFNIGTGNFTVECFVNFTAWAGTFQRIFIQGVSGTTNVSLGRESGGTALNVDINTTNVISYTWTPNIGQWYHLAVVRTGTGSGQVALYIDGVSVATGTSSASVGQNQFIVGGLDWASDYNIKGYISNFRYSNTARTITVPTAPYTSDGNTLILTCQTNRFVDNSTNNFTITRNGDVTVTPFSPFPITTAYDPAVNGGSGYFDGSGDYLTVASGDPILPTGTQDYAVEAWVYWGTQATAAPQFVANPATNGFQIYYDVSGGVLAVGKFNVGNVITYSIAQTALAGQWTHVLATRNGNTHRLFVNGVLRANGVDSHSFAALTTQSIGSGGASNYIVGYLSGIRSTLGSIPTTYQTASTTNGTAVFTPPAAPTTTTSQGATSGDVEFLANFTNAGIFDNTGFNNLETVGNAQIDTTTKKYGTGSMEFDGTGDWLLGQSTPNFVFGTGDFTVEMWIYPTTLASSTDYDIIDFRNGSDTTSFRVGINGTTIPYVANTGGILNGSFTFSTNNWYHLAVTRASGTLTIWVNGTSAGSNTTTTNFTGTNLIIGASANSGARNPFFGLIDDLRITKGIARYTTAFTPPTAAFPNIGE